MGDDGLDTRVARLEERARSWDEDIKDMKSSVKELGSLKTDVATLNLRMKGVEAGIAAHRKDFADFRKEDTERRDDERQEAKTFKWRVYGLLLGILTFVIPAAATIIASLH